MMDDIAVDCAAEDREDQLEWLGRFARRHGRPLRVLHVGNIANNAYLNAKFLRSVGIDAHVLSHDYTHVMGTPEWEDVELRHPHGDDFKPRYSRRDLRGYRRPSWFVSGPLVACAEPLAALCGVRPPLAVRLQNRLCFVANKIMGTHVAVAMKLLLTDPGLLLRKTRGYIDRRRSRQKTDKKINKLVLDALSSSIIADYDNVFRDRTDRLTENDLVPFQTYIKLFRDISAPYDIVQCYATEPIFALLSGKSPYVAFEHGTLRDFTMGDSPLHRLTALGYRKAAHTFITNGDCLAYARRLGIRQFSPVVHPVDVGQHRADFGGAVEKLRREIGGDIILFCPIRHDWRVKGIDVHLRALPLIKQAVAGRVKLVLVRWGEQIGDSEALLEAEGCGADIVWRTSMCRITMIKYIRAADVVLDQMALPHFGATAPQAMAAGTPVISSYVPESTQWIIPTPAPILPAFSPEEVAAAVRRALDAEWLADYRARARAWIDTYHHPNNVILEHLRVYREILDNDE